MREATGGGARDDDGPVVVWANWYRFRPSQRIVYPRVLSRCFLWAVQGGGTVSSNGREIRLDPGSVVRLPWGHSIEYRADARAPFRLGTLHLVPRHTRSAPVAPEVDLMLGDPRRVTGIRSGDDDEPEPGATSTASGAGRRVVDLGSFTIDRFHAEPFDEGVFRRLAELVLREGEDWDAARTSISPAAFDEMTAFVLDNLHRALRVAEVAAAGECSETTAERMFRRVADCSVQTWIRNARMREAARLLRASGLRVGEVAAAVGYLDPLYFSRVFRSAYGIAPSRFASRAALP